MVSKAARRRLGAAMAGLMLATAAEGAFAAGAGQLVGRSVLPEYFIDGPTSGQALGTDPINGRRPPWHRQPIQGFSSVVAEGDGTYWMLSGRGFGTFENSDDHLLRMVRMRADMTGPGGQGPGRLIVREVVTLRDPDRRLPYPITNQFTRNRLLTAADLSLASFQRAPDGTWWLGDTMGPFLIHIDANGKVLDAPLSPPDVAHPGSVLKSAFNPLYEETAGARMMNALRAHARAHGVRRMPVFSPDYLTLDDENPRTVAVQRLLPGSPSSELHNVASLHAAGHRVVPWTCNDPAAMKAMLALGVDGLISDRPDLLRQAVESFDADGDGQPGDYLDADGLIDPARFDAQGHRGGRDLRPESTFPAFEAGLDALVTTLETDCVVTRDGVPVLNHEQHLTPPMARRVDGRDASAAIRSLTLAELQRDFVFDRLQPSRPTQSHDWALSPVSVAFAREYGLASPYTPPSLKQLFQFVRFYERYYRSGAGKDAPDARRRAKNAARVRFDVETKTSPAAEREGLTPDVDTFVGAMAAVIDEAGVAARTEIQSFDYRTLLTLQSRHPALQAVFLLGEQRPLASRDADEAPPAATGPATHWLNDVPWPHRRTYREHPYQVSPDGGIEGLAISPDGRTLYPMLACAPGEGPPDVLPIFEFDLATRRFAPQPWATFQRAPKAVAVTSLILTGPDTGFVIERDGRQGDMSALKRVVAVERQSPGGNMTRVVACDLMRLADPRGLSGRPGPNDIGLGPVFSMPFAALGGLVELGPNRLGLVNDSRYPYGSGRHRANQPDETEFIVIELAAPAP